MTQEEMAKAYDEALERAKKLKETCDSTTVVGWMEYIFPELAEEEKTRKDLLNFLQSPFMKENIADWKVEPWIAWLEKQGQLSQPKVTKTSEQGWSEEDESIALGIEQIVNCASLLNIAPDRLDKVRNWFKSLKERLS